MNIKLKCIITVVRFFIVIAAGINPPKIYDYLDLTCVNDVENEGSPPYWEISQGIGRYDSRTNDFPECWIPRK